EVIDGFLEDDFDHDLVRDVRDECQLAGALDGQLQLALPLGAGARQPSRLDLAALGDELHQQPHILVVDVVDLFRPELADAAATDHAPPPPASAACALVAGALRTAAAPAATTTATKSFSHD